MRRLMLLALVLGCFALPVAARADEASRPSNIDIPSTVADNIYVKLYASRLVRARAEVEMATSRAKYTEYKRARRVPLVATQVVTMQEFEELSRDAANAAVAKKEAEAVATEAESMLRIAVARAVAGRDVPICLELR